MTDDNPSRRIRAADDVETIYDGLQRLRREKSELLNRPEEGEKAPAPLTMRVGDLEVTWFGLCIDGEMRAVREQDYIDWKRDSAVWQSSVERSGR